MGSFLRSLPSMLHGTFFSRHERKFHSESTVMMLINYKIIEVAAKFIKTELILCTPCPLPWTAWPTSSHSSEYCMPHTYLYNVHNYLIFLFIATLANTRFHSSTQRHTLCIKLILLVYALKENANQLLLPGRAEEDIINVKDW